MKIRPTNIRHARACLLALSLFIFILRPTSAQTFTGTGLGLIPDSTVTGPQMPGTPRDVTFSVTGLTANVSTLSVSMTLGSPIHPFCGDIVARLIAPNGASLIIFGYTGATTSTSFGNGADLAGPYTFSDSAAGNWWTTAAATSSTAPIPSGSYRTSAIGGNASGGTLTSLAAVFGGMTPAQANGTWTLRFTDGAMTDTGAVSAASLTFVPVPQPLSVVSRKTHGAAGNFDVNLPLSGAVALEPRNPGANQGHQVVATFGGAVSVNAVSVSGQSGNPQATALASGSQVTVALTGVNNAQQLAITLNITVGGASGDVVIPMRVLLGDVSGNGSVTASDVSQIKSVSGQATTVSNFRSDINLSGGINASDIGSVKVLSGTTVPPLPVIRTPFDYDGDGKTDYVVVRNTGGGSGGAITWFISYAAGGTATVPFGISTDYFLGGDYDGDGKTDIVVWRPGNPSTFMIRQSSNGQVRNVNLGTSADDPTVWGDYDGDGIADVAVFTSTASAGTFTYIGSFNNPTLAPTSITLSASSPFPAPGDYDGDGKADACVQSGTQMTLRRSSDGVIETITFGAGTNTVVPGDYDFDRRTDFCQAHASAGQYLWDILYRSGGGTGGTPITFGATTTDFITQGDYDGDGKTDLATWRNTTGTFSIRRSSDGAVATFPWGASGDYPVANANTH